MKRVQIALSLVVLTGLTIAQSKPQDQKATSKQEQLPSFNTGGQVPSFNKPAEQAPAKGKTPPQAKSNEEMAGYNQVLELIQKKDAAGAEQAANAFAEKYKNSELRYLLYHHVMSVYQEQNNAEKAIEMGRKTLALNPTEPITLAMVASFITERTRDTDLDKEERLNEAMQFAQKSLDGMDTELIIPPGTPQDRVDANKALLRSIAYGAIGNAWLGKADYKQAEDYLKKAIDATPEQGDAVIWLRYSIALDHQKRYREAIQAVNKSLELAPPDSPQANMAQAERKRLLQLAGAALANKPAQAPAPAPSK